MLQTIPQEGGDYLLQKKIEVMLELQYKKIKADIDSLRSAVDNLAVEMQGFKSSARKEMYAESTHIQQAMPQMQVQQPPMPQQAQVMQAQPIQTQPMSQMQPQAMQPQPTPQQAQVMQAQPMPQQATPTTLSGAQQAFQKGLTSDDVSIEKFFNFGKKR